MTQAVQTTQPTLTTRQTSSGWTGGQFSVLRCLQAAYLATAGGLLIALAPDVPMTVVAVVGLILTLNMLLGWGDRVAAGLLALLFAYLAWRHPEILSMRIGIAGAWLVPLIPAVHALSPPRPYGSVAAIGRDDPGNGWTLSGWRWWSRTAVVAVAFFILGLAALFFSDNRFRQGEALASGWLGLLPVELVAAATWSVLAGWLAFALIWPARNVRPWIWCWLVINHTVLLPLAGMWWAGLTLAMLQLVVFEPRWLPSRVAARQQNLFYDGYCGLCHRWVRFVLSEDPGGRCFVLSPLQGELIGKELSATQRDSLPDSIVVKSSDGRVLCKSAAILYILDTLGGVWRITAWLGHAVPTPLRDAVYDGIAGIRHRVFKRPAEACPLVPVELRDRFVL